MGCSFLPTSSVPTNLTVISGEFVGIEREEELIRSQFGIIDHISRKCIMWVACRVLLCHIIISFLHHAPLVLHGIAGIAIDGELTGRDALVSDRVMFIDDRLLFHVYTFNLLRTRFQSQIQTSVLEVEKLTAAVGRSRQEVVERFIILHQVGMYKLRSELNNDLFPRLFAVSVHRRRIHVLQHAHPFEVYFYRRFSKLEVETLFVQNLRTQLQAGIYLTIFVERHQLVHAVNDELHKNSDIAISRLRKDLVYIIVFCNDRITVLQPDFLHEKHFGKLRDCLFGPEADFCHNLSRLIDPTVKPEIMQVIFYA